MDSRPNELVATSSVTQTSRHEFPSRPVSRQRSLSSSQISVTTLAHKFASPVAARTRHRVGPLANSTFDLGLPTVNHRVSHINVPHNSRDTIIASSETPVDAELESEGNHSNLAFDDIMNEIKALQNQFGDLSSHYDQLSRQSNQQALQLNQQTTDTAACIARLQNLGTCVVKGFNDQRTLLGETVERTLNTRLKDLSTELQEHTKTMFGDFEHRIVRDAVDKAIEPRIQEINVDIENRTRTMLNDFEGRVTQEVVELAQRRCDDQLEVHVNHHQRIDAKVEDIDNQNMCIRRNVGQLYKLYGQVSDLDDNHNDLAARVTTLENLRNADSRPVSVVPSVGSSIPSDPPLMTPVPPSNTPPVPGTPEPAPDPVGGLPPDPPPGDDSTVVDSSSPNNFYPYHKDMPPKLLDFALKEHVNPVPSAYLVPNPLVTERIAVLRRLAKADPRYHSSSLIPLNSTTWFSSSISSAPHEIMNPFVVLADSLPVVSNTMTGTLTHVFHWLLTHRKQNIKAFAPAKNGLKLDLNFKYDGSSNPKLWHEFIIKFLNFCDLHNLGGEESDWQRIQLLFACMEGAARAFFERNVLSPLQKFAEWSFILIVDCLQNQFVIDEATATAQIMFDSLIQNELSLPDYIDERTFWASFLPIPPDDSTFRARFMQGLKPSIACDIANRGYDRRTCDFNRLAVEAKRSVAHANRKKIFDKEINLQHSMNLVYQAVANKSVVNSNHRDTIPTKTPYNRPPSRTRFRSRQASPVPRIHPGSRQNVRSPSPKPNAMAINTRTCYICQSADHLQRECPLNPRASKSPAPAVREVIESGHIIPDPETSGLFERVIASPIPRSHRTADVYRIDEHHGEEEYHYSDDEINDDNHISNHFGEDDTPYSHGLHLIELVDCNAVAPKIPSSSKPPIKVHTGTNSLKAERPERPAELKKPLSVYATINGVRAHLLLDSGAEVDLISPSFIDQCKNAEVHRLDKQLGLGMAVEGSHSTITYGAWIKIQIGPFSVSRHYMDVQKCSKYDGILGIPFMTKHNISLCLGPKKSFSIGDFQFPNEFKNGDGDQPVTKCPKTTRPPLRVTFESKTQGSNISPQ